MGNIVGENFDDYVINQVKKRQEILGSVSKTNQQLVWENSRTGWVKLVSSADLVDPKYLPSFIKSVGYTGGAKLAERFVLFNGVTDEIPNTFPGKENIQRAGIGLDNAWSGNNAYGLGGSDFGLQPMPGIISANIKTETRGTLKTGTVNIKANNKQQFDIINTLYLKLGYMMLLEWGNNCYYDNNGNFISDNNLSLADPFLRATYTYGNILDVIEKYRDKSCGNYDALVGKVVNFNWTFNKDGSYNIVIIIRSMGDIIDSLKTNSLLPITPTSTPGITTDKSQEIIKSYAETNSMARHFSGIIDMYELSNGTYDKINGLSPYKENPDDPYFDYFGQEYNGSIQYFVRFGKFLSLIEKFYIPDVKVNTSNSKLISFDKDVTTNLIASHPKQVPSDPRICVFSKTLETYKPAAFTTDSIIDLYPGVVGTVSVNGRLDPNTTITSERFPLPEDPYTGKLMMVYFNMVYILDQLNTLRDKDGKVPLVELLNAMMTGFCKSTGNINSISTRVNFDTNKIIFIDQTILQNRDLYIKNSDPFNFNVYGLSPSEGSFIRDLQLKTGITSDLATMVTIGSTATGYVTGQDATLLSNLNKGTIDRIKPEIQSPDIGNRTSEESNSNTEDVYRDAQDAFDNFLYEITVPNSAYTNLVTNTTQLLPKWNEDLYSKYTNTQVQLLEYEIKKNTNSNRFNPNPNEANPYTSSPTNGFLPFDLNLTMDGLSGMKIYQKYTIDSKFLPSNYPEAMEFIIKGISNTIQNNVWTTNIESLAIPKNPVPVPQSIVRSTPTRSSVETYRGSEEVSDSGIINFLRKVLQGIGIPAPNNNQIRFMRIWRQIEGGRATWNPFNTTLLRPGSLPYSETNTPGIFVQNYISESQGLEATISTLKEPEFKPIIDSIKLITDNNIRSIDKTMAVVNNTPAWGTTFPIGVPSTSYVNFTNKIWKTPVPYFNYSR